VVKAAEQGGFTGKGLCSSDSAADKDEISPGWKDCELMGEPGASDDAEQGGEGSGVWTAMDYHALGERVWEPPCPCRKLGSGSDKGIIPEVLEHFERMMGGLPEMVVYVGVGMGRRITRC